MWSQDFLVGMEGKKWVHVLGGMELLCVVYVLACSGVKNGFLNELVADVFAQAVFGVEQVDVEGGAVMPVAGGQ